MWQQMAAYSDSSSGRLLPALTDCKLTSVDCALGLCKALETQRHACRIQVQPGRSSQSGPGGGCVQRGLHSDHRRCGLSIRDLVSRIRELSPLAVASAIESPLMCVCV